MAVFNLTAIISKFLKQISLSELEQEQIRDEIGAVGVSESSEGGNGDDDAGLLTKFAVGGGLTATSYLKVVGESYTSNIEVSMRPESVDGTDKSRLSNVRLGDESFLELPQASANCTVKCPDFSCTLVGGDPVTGLINPENVDQIFTAQSVSENVDRYALGLEAARNKIIIDYENMYRPAMYILEPNATATSAEGDWIFLGRLADVSEGGNGDFDFGKNVSFGFYGEISATYEFTVRSYSELDSYFRIAGDGFNQSIWVAGENYSGQLLFPGDLTANRLWTMPNVSGTILTDATAVTLNTVQTITGGKTLSGPVNFGDDVAFTDSTATLVVAPTATFNNDTEFNGNSNLMPNQVADDDDSIMTRILGDVRYAGIFEYLDTDGTSYQNQTTLQNSTLVVPLTVGVWEISVWAPFTTASTPGAKVGLNFSGTMSTIGGWSSIGSDATAPFRTQIIGSTGAEGFNGVMIVTGSSTASFETKVLYDVTVDGDLTLQYAQQVSNASFTTLKAGAWIRARQIS